MIREEDLEIQAGRKPEPYGMRVPDTSGYVRVTHKPTGIWAHSDSERSQIQNKAKAVAELEVKVAIHQLARLDRLEQQYADLQEGFAELTVSIRQLREQADR